jgi:hypothetical protein
MQAARPTSVLPISAEDRASGILEERTARFAGRATDYPAVLPALKYSIQDLWAGRVSASVSAQREILQMVLRRSTIEPVTK